MTKRILTIALLGLLPFIATAKITIIEVHLPAGISHPLEAHYRDALVVALKNKGESPKIEVKCDGGRVDILTEEYAIEVKTATQWHKAIGQAAHYATVLKRKPAIAIFDVKKLTAEKRSALEKTAEDFKIEVFELVEKTRT